ncbi:MAG TPA: hypothetical protein VHR66_10860 [Gemmataceae bacterium]|jgi:hypothetical protein|nr:hypothetical protein [Gemmataceae bacterium]
MARMTREFSLVLVGSGILTAGHFLYPEEDLEAKQKEQVAQQLGGNNVNNNGQRHYRGGGFIWIHTGAWAASGSRMGGRPPAMGGGNVSRGGFGGIGRGAVGG